MMLESWLPIGHELPDGTRSKTILFEGSNWQILETQGGGRALLVRESLAERWTATGLTEEGLLTRLDFGDQEFRVLSSSPSQALCPVSEAESAETKSEALAFAVAFSATRAIDKETPLQDAIYAEKISRLLPTYSISSCTDDALVLGYWLTGGANVSAQSFRRLRQMTGWLGVADLNEIVAAAGIVDGELPDGDSLEKADVSAKGKVRKRKSGGPAGARKFELPGRPELESFFNDHIIDIVENSARYKALGIDFPGAIVLHGPPGCGKTFAVEKLVEFLGWPSFQIDASSIGSKYIHETSMKTAAIFDKAMDSSPSVLVIDEMEGFLAERSMESGQYRIEEVGEFLRRIPEASKNEVLVVAMTNRIDMIDQAILRRGRFDHIIKVGHASQLEIMALLDKLLSAIPKESDVDAGPLATRLAGRPLSDVAFVVREAARLSARSGSDKLSQDSLMKALIAATADQREREEPRHIGFV